MWKGSSELEPRGSRLQAGGSPWKCPGLWERCPGEVESRRLQEAPLGLQLCEGYSRSLQEL